MSRSTNREEEDGMEKHHGALWESDQIAREKQTSGSRGEVGRRESNGKERRGALLALLLPLCCVLPLLLVALAAWLASLLAS